MKKLLMIACSFCVISTAASAGKMWESYGVAVAPNDADKIVAATDKLMSSTEGKAFPGKLMLLSNIANGTDPTTTSWVAIYKSAKDAADWGKSVEGSQAWKDFSEAVEPISKPTGEARYSLVKNWGTPNDATSIWHAHLVKSSDSAAVIAALNKWFASAKGKKFPGEAYLSAPIAAGASPVTHFVSVGFKDEAQMEEWADSLQGDPDYATLIEELSAVSDHLGATLSYELKEWGKPMKDVVK